MTKRQETPPEEDQNILEQGKTFWYKYQNWILGIGGVLIAVIGYYVYQNNKQQQKQAEVLPEIAMAQTYFAVDSTAKALNGDGTNLGLLDVIDEYSGTPTAETAEFMAGVLMLKEGNIDEGITYLEDFSSESEYLNALGYQLLGNAYAQQGDQDKALKYYEKAVDETDNAVWTPYYAKIAGNYHRFLGNKEEALKYYQMITEEYPLSEEVGEAERYIALLNVK